MAHLKLSLLGPPVIELDERSVALERRKTLALLVYLAVTGEAHGRDGLATLLWPEADQAAARAALRRDLAVLNRVIGPGWLGSDQDAIRFKRHAEPAADPGQTSTLDVNRFHDLLASCVTHGHSATTVCEECLRPLAEAVKLYRADFLAGFTLRDSPAFDEWQFFQAETLRQELASALDRLVHGYSTHGEEGRSEAIPYARSRLSLDTLHEPAHRHLMQLYASTGRQAAALRQYGECVRILHDELGVPPSEETTRLYEAIKAQRVLAPSIDEPPFALRSEASTAAQPRERSLFVAQERELARLDHFLDQAAAGQGQVVFVMGEAGSGKTALVREFGRRAQSKLPDLVAAAGNCNAYTGWGDPYLPFREILGRISGDEAAGRMVGDPADARRVRDLALRSIGALVKAGPDLVDTFVSGSDLMARAERGAFPDVGMRARLKDLVARHQTGPGPANVNQADLFEQYARVIKALVGSTPMLLVLDDLHWADLGSINLLFHLGRRLRDSRVLLVGIFRPDEVALGRGAAQSDHEATGAERARHPLESLVNEFQLQFGDIVIDLAQAADRHFVNALLDAQPNGLGPAFREALYLHTGGHALFTVEMLRGMRERGDLVEDAAGRWVEGPALSWEVLPARVEGVIGERLGRLPAMLREMLKVASVEGEVFTAEVVARVQMIDERLMVGYLSDQLDRQHHLVRNQSSHRLSPGGQPLSLYRFRHILFQKYLYASLDDAECTYLHEAVGQVLEHLYGTQAEEIAVQLARHFEAAGWPDRAIAYLQQAGNRAVKLSANQEALAHFNKGLALLQTLPVTTERVRQELALQIALFAPLAAVKGYGSPEVGLAYTRARELCLEVDDAPLLFQVLYGLWGHNLVQAQFAQAREFAHQCLALAEAGQHGALLLEGNRMVGETAFHRGELPEARKHLERSRALYDPRHHRAHATLYGQDPGVALLSHGSWALWHLGYPDQALAWSREAIALAQAGAHPFSSVFALEYACILHQLRGEPEESEERAAAAMAVSIDQKFVEWLAIINASQGWLLVEKGDVTAGIAQMQRGLDAYRATGSEMFVSYFLTLLARADIAAAQTDAAFAAVDEGLARTGRTEGRLWEPEFYRLKGELSLAGGRRDVDGTAEALLLQSLELARGLSARSQELRAAVSLGRLWVGQGKRADAHRLLAPVYGWFAEGLETADLREARALLDEWG